MTNIPALESSLITLFEASMVFAASRCHSAFTRTTMRDSAMNSAAGTPLPETSAISTPIRPCSSAMTSNGMTSKKSPPTSFAITLRAATSKPATCGSTSGRKLCWICPAISSSALERATRSSISLRSVMSRIVSMAPASPPSGP